MKFEECGGTFATAANETTGGLSVDQKYHVTWLVLFGTTNREALTGENRDYWDE